MDHLSSCYFCGTALDRPLQTVRLADSAAGEDAPALTLCPPCRRKLERVLEVARANGSVDPGTAGSGAATEQADAGEDGLMWGRPGGGAADASAEAAAGETPEEILEEVSQGDDTDEVEADESADVEQTADESADAAETTEESADDAETTGESADAEETDGETEEDDETSEPTGTVDGPAKADSGATDESGTTAEESTQTDGESSGTTDGGGDSAKRTVVEDQGGSSLSALEYNKVIRLLQNREFPVDRDEIVTIAANAYDLRRSECAAILDLAVERDVLAESDGQLYRPE